MKLKLLIESYTHKISIYPIISIIYDGEVSGEYEFPNAGQTIEITACLSQDDASLTDKFIEPYMKDIKFDDDKDLQDQAFEKFKKEKFIVDPDNLSKSKIQFKTSKSWEYAEDEAEE